jgi:diacylglycerol kinase family enzyme
MANDFASKKVAVVFNTASGSYTHDAQEKLLGILLEHGIADPMVAVCTPDEVEAAFCKIEEDHPDLLIVLGGDGTIRSGAESCLDSETLLMPLPGGTMNMLPKALYGTRDWATALSETLTNPTSTPVASGEVGGKQFFIAAVIGSPTLWTQAREALREGDLRTTIERGMHAFTHMLAATVRYSFSSSTSGEATAIAVICPLISKALDDQEEALEAAVIDVRSMGDVLALASKSAFGEWRDHEKVEVVRTTSISISADEEIPIILDGETMELGKELTISFVPKAFTALVPATHN